MGLSAAVIENNIEKHAEYMFDSFLTQAQIKRFARIKKANLKGIEKHDYAAYLSNYFLKEDNLKHDFNALSEDETAFFNALKTADRPVEFKRIMKYLDDSDWFENKDYNRVLREIKENYCSRGLLLLIKAELVHWNDDKLDRYYVYLPRLFYKYVPCINIKAETIEYEETGKNRFFDLLKKVLLDEPEVKKTGLFNKIDVSSEGVSISGKKVYSFKIFCKRVVDEWFNLHGRAVVKSGYKSIKSLEIENNKVIFHILRSVYPKRVWLKEIEAVFKKITLLEKPKVEKYLKVSHKLGVVDKTTSKKVVYYCLSKDIINMVDNNIDYEAGDIEFALDKNKAVVDIAGLNTKILFEILISCNYEFNNSKIIFSPCIRKLGLIYEDNLFADNMIYNSAVKINEFFKSSFEYVKDNYAKSFIHSNLLLYNITDLTAHTLIKTRFKEAVALGNSYLALPKSSEAEVAKFLDKNKYSLQVKEEKNEVKLL